MISFYINSNIIVQTLIATLITFLVTALGSFVVFAFKKVNKIVLDSMLGFSAGVMIAASFFSLLNPAINGAEDLLMNSALVVSVGFVIGGLFLIISDRIIEKAMVKRNNIGNNGLKRSLMLIFSVTLHNIPEGLAIGVAFGSVYKGLPNSTLMGAFMLAIGVAIQNFPEGAAISLPLRRDGFSKKTSFIYGALSGVVEPISGILGCVLVLYIKNVLPFFLSFAAGAMIYVAVSELIPESQKNEAKNIISFFTIFGFVIMMFLDVLLG